MTTFTVAAVCFLDADQRLLTVRKQGTHMFMLPGGKLEPGESAAAAAVREIGEEVGIVLTEADLEPVGVWVADAANEPGATIHSTVFRAPLTGTPAAAGEIAELRWVQLPVTDTTGLAPLLSAHVLPALTPA
ncbi:NUDIX hydrolase [Luteipulveratus halotolerans]|uniref:NUDIX hydrolase n=1 Tax=Luteipulveratus halotolerans TaxID=1631356 RepID=A0A0L6CLH6_9MICO|nr:NUDIX domain-containing protein [Luteipulveratus halotolerans]KNX38656.1 NUDIX hydrolase [Luteipulveratus halotolerans]